MKLEKAAADAVTPGMNPVSSLGLCLPCLLVCWMCGKCTSEGADIHSPARGSSLLRWCPILSCPLLSRRQPRFQILTDNSIMDSVSVLDFPDYLKSTGAPARPTMSPDDFNDSSSSCRDVTAEPIAKMTDSPTAHLTFIPRKGWTSKNILEMQTTGRMMSTSH